MDTTPADVITDPDTPEAPAASRCPVDHVALAAAAAAGGCPVVHTARRPRSKADEIARRILFIKDRPEGVTSQQAYSAFQKSMMISATRCILTYVIFPFVLPAIGIVSNFGSGLGVAIGTFAIGCDIFSIRRFHSVEHKYRWHFTAVAGCVIGMLGYLLVQDWIHLFT
ncbi:MAG: hypothetical protein U0Q03_16200 [Acidimicrobiales bacterium]